MIELQQKYAKMVNSTFGDVDRSTPLYVVREKINHIPERTLINPNSRFLEPSAGIGTYAVVLFNKLLEYHDRDHILNNMIYLVEIKEYKCEYLKLLGFKNIYNTNYLTHDFKKMDFDIILSNIPFNNEGGMKSKGLNGAQQGKTNLYKEFIAHSKSMIKPNGIIIFIAPPGAYKSFLNNSLNILKYYFNSVDAWGKSIATVSWFCSLDPTIELGDVPITIQDKLFTNDHDKIRQRASKKEHSYYLYNYIKPLKVYNNDERNQLSIKDQGKTLPPVTLTDSKINKTNLEFLLSYLLNYLNNHGAQWHSFNKRLKYEWLEDIDYVITEDDIIKQYKLTQEEVNIINTTR